MKTEIDLFSAKLSKIGYLSNKFEPLQKVNDSLFIARIDLGPKINTIQISIVDAQKYLSTSNLGDTINIQYTDIDAFLSNTLQDLEKKGYPFAKIQLANLKLLQKNLTADLILNIDKKKVIDEIIVKENEEIKKSIFPKSHLLQLNRKFRNRLVNKTTLSEIKNEIDKFNFVSISKTPEILFTADSTKVYVFIESKKTNSFDGYVGFSNNDNQKIKINGYLDLKLENTIRAGEKFALYWKNDGNQQTIFKSILEVPYVFKSPFGVKAEINILKKDSSYQNTKTALQLGYFINYNSRVYAGFEATTSSDILNNSVSTILDYKNSFATLNFEYINNESDNNRAPTKTAARFKIGSGNRKSNSLENKTTTKQLFFDMEAEGLISFNQRNGISIRNQSYYLNSSKYITNELQLFGGINSIRGFTENSLQGNLFTAILTEYRYTLSPSIYINTITDLGILKNPLVSNKLLQVYSVGFGTAIATANGLLKINLSNGTIQKQRLNFYNTILQVSYNVKF
jgi:hypothetical protein